MKTLLKKIAFIFIWALLQIPTKGVEQKYFGDGKV